MPQIRDLCAGFGEVLATTVRKKEGTNKSWSLVTFTSPDCVEEAMAAGVRATVVRVTCDLLWTNQLLYRSYKPI